jgi:hypothetical protein
MTQDVVHYGTTFSSLRCCDRGRVLEIEPKLLHVQLLGLALLALLLHCTSKACSFL